MNQQPTKRTNPFDSIQIPDIENEQEEQKPVQNIERNTQPQPVYTERVEKPVQTAPRKPVRETRKPTMPVYDEADREKYTSTMSIALRREIKIVCAQTGIMFAKFVEDACIEKLDREGFRRF